MNQLAPLNQFSMQDSDGIFAPVSPDLIGGLLTSYKFILADIKKVAEMATGSEFHHAMHYFAHGNCDKDGRNHFSTVSKLFNPAGAIASLNSSYWQKALKLTDVYEMMPQKRRDAWDEQISKGTTPDFTAEAVIPTIVDLLNLRPLFLAERVDGLFRALSSEHVTNCPQGFSKRMIMYVYTNGFTNTSQCGHLTDLRKVIAKFMGRDEPQGSDVSCRVADEAMRRSGEWMTIDGGALRIRVYKKGTAHLEIHPEMAWRLNAILAHLHPLAIPPAFRTKPTKKAKEFELIQKPLPFAVIRLLSDLKPAYEPIGEDFHRRYKRVVNAIQFSGYQVDKHVMAEAKNVLYAIGAVAVRHGNVFQFDYDSSSIIGEIICSGCIPDHKSHQYYPTPELVAKAAIELAEIGPDHLCLEPSAGQGGLAGFMPKERTTCIEISELHCNILREKGFYTEKADFLKTDILERFERVVMNPPFSQGRWQAHTDKAAAALRSGGVLVAILPAGARNKYELDGFECSWSGPFDNEFDGTGVSVVILKAIKK
jgi:hypothetical protein